MTVVAFILCYTVHIAATPAGCPRWASIVSDKWIEEPPPPVPVSVPTGAKVYVVRLPRPGRRYLVRVRSCYTWCDFATHETDARGYDAAVPERPWPPPP